MTRFKQSHLALAALLSTNLFSSCKQDDEFDIRIVNHTDFQIDVLEIRDRDFEYKFVIPHNDSTEIETIDLVTKRVCPMTGRYLHFSVEEYSDSMEAFVHTSGSTGQNRMDMAEVTIFDINLTDSPEFLGSVFNVDIRE